MARGGNVLVLALALLASGISGCGFVAERMANHLARAELDSQFRLPVRKFTTCIAKRGGFCPGASARPEATPTDPRTPDALTRILTADTPAALAANLLDSSVQQQLLGLPGRSLQAAFAGITRSSPLELQFQWVELDHYFSDIERVTQLDGWAALEREANLAAATDAAAAEYHRVVRYVSAYMAAYFRNGKFFSATVDTAGLDRQIQNELRARFGQAQLPQGLVQSIRTNLVGFVGPDGRYFGNIGDVGLITRTGAKYQFPPLEASVNPSARDPLAYSRIDVNEIANDLVRVFIEATFDAKDGLPCVSNATAAGIIELDQPPNDPDKATVPDSRFLAAADFQTVQEWGSRTDAAVTALVGRAVRGAGWASLNNEKLADLLATAVGTAARKTVEKVAWCDRRCSGQGMLVADGDTVPVHLLVSGPPPSFVKDPR